LISPSGGIHISEEQEDPDFFKFKFGDQEKAEEESIEQSEEVVIEDEEENEEKSTSADKEVDKLLLGSLKQLLDFENVTYVSLIKKEGKLMGEVKEEDTDDPDFYYTTLSTSYAATMGSQSGRKPSYISIAMSDCYYLMREMNNDYIFALRLENYKNFKEIIETIDEESEFLNDKWTRTQIITKLRRKYNFSR